MCDVKTEVLTLGMDDVPRWGGLRKQWLEDFMSTYGPMDECLYHCPRPWIEHEDIARSIRESDQVFLGIPDDEDGLVAGMHVKRRGQDLCIEGFFPRVLRSRQRRGLGSALLSWCVRELREGRVRRIVSKLHGREVEIRPYIEFYRKNGFFFDHGHPRLEMVADISRIGSLRGRPVKMMPARDLGMRQFTQVYMESYRQSTVTGLSHERQDRGRTGIEDYEEELLEMRRSFAIDPFDNWYAAYSRDHPVGVILCGLKRDRVTADVTEFAVMPEERGKGIGTYMLSWSLGRLRELGAGKAALGVDCDNLAARRVYEKLGFRTVHMIAYLLLGSPPHL